MKKYDENKLFEKTDKFTKKDELQLTCVTLNSSVKSNYFSLSESNTDKLSKSISQTMIWLLDHQNELDQVYESKLNEINSMCNEIYHSMHKMKILETVKIANEMSKSDSDSDSESGLEDTPKQKITENIDMIIRNLPSKPSRKKIISKVPDKKKISDSVFLKLDVNKLTNGHVIKFKS